MTLAERFKDDIELLMITIGLMEGNRVEQVSEHLYSISKGVEKRELHLLSVKENTIICSINGLTITNRKSVINEAEKRFPEMNNIKLHYKDILNLFFAEFGLRIDTINYTHGLRKLTDEQILEIVELLNKGYKQAVVARMYGVHRTTIFNIKHGYRYKKLTIQK